MHRRGLALGLLSGATFATSGSWATSLIDAGWSPGAVALARVAGATALLTLPALLVLRGMPVSRALVGKSATFGLVGIAGTQLCFYQSLAYLSVGEALLVEYSSVLLVVAWARLRHGRRLGHRTQLGSLLAVLGLALALDVASGTHLEPAGIAWAFGAALGIASYFVLSSDTGDHLPPLVWTWAGLAWGSVALGVLGMSGALALRATTADVTLLDDSVSWAVSLVGVVVVAGVVPYDASVRAVRLLGPTLSSFVLLSEVLFGIALAWLLVGQRLAPAQWLGCAMVVAGIVLVKLDEVRSRDADEVLETAALPY